MNYQIQNEKLCAIVSDNGAELISLKKGETEYIWQADEAFWKRHSPLLFPVCGRLLENKYRFGEKEYKMGSHGFARDKVFSLIDQKENKLVFLLKSSDETKEIYPFDFSLTAEFLISDSELTVNYTVCNEGDKVLPYMLGWHPGFMLIGDGDISDFSVDFGESEKLDWYPMQNGCFLRPYGEDYPLKNGKYFLNEEEIYKNDTMSFTKTGSSARLLSPKNEEILEINYSRNLPYLCIWKAPDCRARYICLEPWTGLPSDGETPENFETRKMERLAPGKSEIYTYVVKIN